MFVIDPLFTSVDTTGQNTLKIQCAQACVGAPTSPIVQPLDLFAKIENTGVFDESAVTTGMKKSSPSVFSFRI